MVVFWFACFCFVFGFETGSISSPGYPGISYVDQAPPFSASRVPGLKVCITTPGLHNQCKGKRVISACDFRTFSSWSIDPVALDLCEHSTSWLEHVAEEACSPDGGQETEKKSKGNENTPRSALPLPSVWVPPSILLLG